MKQPPSNPHLPPSNRDLKVAIVHDWLVGGGAELVVEQLHQLFPDAPIYTSYCSPEWRKRLDGKVVTGYLQYWPFSRLRKIMILPRMLWFRHLNLKKYDLVISSCGNGEAKHVLPQKKNSSINYQSSTIKVKGPLHISYIHAPTHYYWRHHEEYMKNPGFAGLNPIIRLFLKTLVKPLRKLDYKAAQRPHLLIANSTHTKNDIKKYYNRDSSVIFPPVYMERFSPAKGRERKGFLIAGRQTPYKRFDLAVEVCNKLQLPLTVIGTGPEHERLKKIAGHSVTFLGKVPDEEIEHELASAEGFIFPTYEDFGITPVEAMASGTPVIAYQKGGALDYVVDGRTGLFFKHQTVDSLMSALERFPGHDFRAEIIAKEARRFSKEQFKMSFMDLLGNLYRKPGE